MSTKTAAGDMTTWWCAFLLAMKHGDQAAQDEARARMAELQRAAGIEMEVSHEA